MSYLFNIQQKYQSLSELDPFNVTYRLSLQIVILQLFYYFTALALFLITSLLSGWDFKLEWIFSWSIITVENSEGLSLIILWLITALFSTVFIAFIIGRSKVVWDFAVTIHFIHFMLVIFIEGFPKNIYWWLLEMISMVLMIVLSTYMSRWIELRDTFFENLNDVELGNISNK